MAEGASRTVVRRAVAALGRNRRLRLRRRITRNAQDQAKTCDPIVRAVETQVAILLACQTPGDGQAEAAAASRRPTREERIEQMLLGHRTWAGAVVLDYERHTVACI